MSKKVGCHCRKNPACKLCGGTGQYDYEPGPRGWMPFTCPTCAGKRSLTTAAGGAESCFTCQGNGQVDPADPPSSGWGDVIWKAVFGAT